MKDYSLSSDKGKKFVKNYKIKKGNIKINYAKGKPYTVPYNKHNEEIILDRMEQQVKEAKITNFNKINAILLAMMVISLPVVISNLITSSSVLWGILSTLLGIGVISQATKYASYLLKKSELKKLQFFLNNKNMLNTGIEENPNIMCGVKKKAASQIKQTPVTRQPFDINVIDNFSLTDLITLKTNIEREESFGFAKEEIIEKEKRVSLIK